MPEKRKTFLGETKSVFSEGVWIKLSEHIIHLKKKAEDSAKGNEVDKKVEEEVKEFVHS